ncbi:hypothetical protein Tco_0971640 [Tanacetum coccineum]
MKLGDLSIDAYFRKIESIVTILSSLGSPISNDDLVNIALDGLPKKYNHVSNNIIHREPFLDLKTVRSMLTTTEMRLKSQAQATHVDSTSSSPMVLLANSDSSSRRSQVVTDKGFVAVLTVLVTRASQSRQHGITRMFWQDLKDNA